MTEQHGSFAAAWSDYRDDVVKFLRRQMIGPTSGASEVLADAPTVRYLLGILYPQKAFRAEALKSEDDDESGSDEDGIPEVSIATVDDWLPSSMACSFYVRGDKLRIELWASRYTESASKARRWTRQPLAEPDAPEVVPIEIDRNTEMPVLSGRATLSSLSRPFADGFLVTVALLNAYRLELDRDTPIGIAERKQMDAESLHQVGFRCTVQNGEFLEYPTAGDGIRDEEEEELRLLYSHAGVYAVGHGCSVRWEFDPAEKPSAVVTEHMPTHDVPPLDYDLPGFEDLLQLRNIIAFDDHHLIVRLNDFIEAYQKWCTALEFNGVPVRQEAAKARIISRVRETIDRMRMGVQYLSKEADAMQCFRLSNQAMLMQMHQTKFVVAEKSYARDEPKFVELSPTSAFAWRPFQLAFQLLTFESAAESDSVDRSVVDLIWFPTGGGKTEAYLALAAFVIFLRRHRLSERAVGTAVFTRYTLSLLTAQQFQRAATLICACEELRARDEATLGTKPITIGLWIGDKHTPNRYNRALELLEELLEEDEPRNPFQLQQCPWCGTLIVPSQIDPDRQSYGIRATERSFQFFCPTSACPFNHLLPIGVIDEQLYDQPPTFLLATVDKFAQLPWEPRAGIFFGSAETEPPGLIIQDELHLLSGPLGTMVGLYETGIETLISLNGAAPKIVASTATIRRASEQISGLFGRPVTRVFPPSGTDSRDSYYARESSRPGRRYVGILPQSHSTQTSVVNLASALLQSPVSCGLTGDELDGMSTLVVYHNSLRELGRTINLSRDDVPERIKAWFGPEARELTEDGVMELRSNLDGAALPKRLLRLKLTHDNAQCVSIVGCTNMFSVGVDVPRLALMLVNGQPKSVSEYIQATSRVGRGSTAGLVVTLFGATRPRDRSLYEQFGAFHANFYMRVEPTSVTPFSPPSRARALHAVIVLLMRHFGKLRDDDGAGGFQKNAPEVKIVLDALKSRVQQVDPGENEATTAEIYKIFDEWQSLADEARAKRKPLFYRSAGRSHTNLLAHFGKANDGFWETPDSLRNVDAECSLAVLGAK